MVATAAPDGRCHPRAGPSATATARVSARKPDSIGGQHATDDQGVEHVCASGAVQAEQAGRLRQCEIESGHLSEFRPHSCTEVMFDRRVEDIARLAGV